jgi:hypothetical protein
MEAGLEVGEGGAGGGWKGGDGGSGWKERVASTEKWSLREQPRSGCRIIMPTLARSTLQVPPRAVASPELAKM